MIDLNIEFNAFCENGLIDIKTIVILELLL